MKKFVLEEITSSDLIDHAAIAQEFKNYLMNTLEYDEFEADFVVENDFSNPYDTPFILQDFEDRITIDGTEYEVRFCRTDFCACGLFHFADVEPFEFYMLFDMNTMADTTVGSYQRARKMYLF